METRSNERKWTPGPWFADEAFVWAETDTMLFDASDMDDQAEAFADAHLIAAAPDLYEALERALFWLEIDGRYDVQGMKIALAKARGEK